MNASVSGVSGRVYGRLRVPSFTVVKLFWLPKRRIKKPSKQFHDLMPRLEKQNETENEHNDIRNHKMILSAY